MKKFDEDHNTRANQRVSTFMNREEALRLEKARELRESVLIKKIALYLILPATVISIVAFFVP